jgi:hypothetical protein
MSLRRSPRPSGPALKFCPNRFGSKRGLVRTLLCRAWTDELLDLRTG